MENIGLVINYDVPASIETYFHRIGRTGRFGRFGISIVFVREKDEDFLFKNREYFVNVDKLPREYQHLNEFLKNNLRVQAERNETIKQMRQQQSQKPAKSQKEFHYTSESELSRWQGVGHQFYDEDKFKYYEDPVELMKEGMQISDELDMYKEIVYNDRMAEENKAQEVDGALHLSSSGVPNMEFLQCRHCYEIALQIQKNLNHKLEILEYFHIKEGYQH